MHDFDYDAMQKKRIARGATHMKRGSKSKKCSLPHDGLTPAQLRRLNGPVSTYKLDEPMNWESFKAMPEDLQKQYIRNLQDTYQANDHMLAKMFCKSNPTIMKSRNELGIAALSSAKMKGKEAEIRNAKWDAFCNGVVGGKPGEPGEIEEIKEPNDIPTGIEPEGCKEALEVTGAACSFENNPNYVDDPSEIRQIKDMLDDMTLDIYKPEELNITFVSEDFHADSINRMIRQMVLPEGRCRIKIEIEKI